MTLKVTIRHRFTSFRLDVDLRVDAPGVTALFGESGAGKTSVVNAIAGLLKPDAGSISVNGECLFDSARGICTPPHQRRIGYVFQDARLFPHLSVRANLLFGWRRSGERAPPAQIEHLVEMLGIAHLLHRAPQTLSAGERQRVALGRALLSAPQLLLLDEPLAAIDQARKHEILPYLERLRDEARIPMLYVSHSIDEVARLADHLIVMNDGCVLGQGGIATMMSRVDLLPLSDRFDASAVVMGRVHAHRPQEGLSEVSFDGGRLLVPIIKAEEGAQARLRIRARSVMLALDAPERISANNVLPVEISAIRTDPDGPYADVQLLCGATHLLARITRHSVNRLALHIGDKVYAIIKSITLESHSAARR
jgi:molybdate transport system ATP-binding protein